MTSIIKQLSQETINQIAAGEVIENPASVVKELIENALDAGAREICIEIEGGGFEKIVIADDGHGMSEIDLALSVLPHTTSKIAKAEDLFALTTMGFRGEALASIAAVSKLTITSAQADASGTQLCIEAGKQKPLVRAARERGTTMEVLQLFFNVPARKKFQKSPSSCLADIFRVVTSLSLAHPEVSFQLRTHKRITLSLKGTTFQKRAQELYGDGWVAKGFEMTYHHPKLRCFGFIGQPSDVRINRLGQQLFINRRAVDCLLLADAVKEGYATRLPKQRFPLFLLHFELPKEFIDANVHPQKREIRLRDSHFFRQKIIEIVSETLSKTDQPLAAAHNHFLFTQPLFDSSLPDLHRTESARLSEEPAAQQPQLDLPEEEAKPLALMGDLLFILPSSTAYLQIVDISSLLFRLAFDGLMQAFVSKKREIEQLLLPLSLLFTPVESAMLMTHMEAIESLGFALRPIGHGAFLIDGLPPSFPENEVKETLSELALALQDWIGKPIDNLAKQRQLARIVAAQVKQNKAMHLDQAWAYFKKWAITKERFCPLGRPIIAEVTSHEFKKIFLHAS